MGLACKRSFIIGSWNGVDPNTTELTLLARIQYRIRCTYSSSAARMEQSISGSVEPPPQHWLRRAAALVAAALPRAVIVALPESAPRPSTSEQNNEVKVAQTRCTCAT